MTIRVYFVLYLNNKNISTRRLGLQDRDKVVTGNLAQRKWLRTTDGLNGRIYKSLMGIKIV